MRDMAPESRKGIDGRLVEPTPVIPGALRDREQKVAQLTGPRRNFLSRLAHSKLGLAAGAAAVIGVLAFGSRGGDNQPNPDTNSVPRPETTETFNPRESALKIIDAKNDNPESEEKVTANIGSALTLNITESSNGHTYPRLRTSTELVDVEGAEIYNVVSSQDVKAINGAPVDLRPGTEIRISNFISVPGYDVDGGLGGPEGEWLALEATLNDGSNKLIFVSLSNQTRSNWNKESTPSSHAVSLDKAINLPGEELNKVEIIK